MVSFLCCSLSYYVAGIIPFPCIPIRILKVSFVANAREGPRVAFANAAPRDSPTGQTLVKVKGKVCFLKKKKDVLHA